MQLRLNVFVTELSNYLINNTALNNQYGIGLNSCCYNYLINNTAKSNQHGFYLHSIHDNILKNNTAANKSNGIYLYVSSTNNTLINNTILDNNFGICLSSSINNFIYNNYFNNINNAWDDGTNTWNISKTDIVDGNDFNIIGGEIFSHFFTSIWMTVIYSAIYLNITALQRAHWMVSIVVFYATSTMLSRQHR